MKNNELAAKEASLFRSTLKFYEYKQYKKGYKVCEQILKKSPDHGETLAMKGLFASNLGKKEEAYDLVKKGIKLNFQSHICWHVYGLIHRGDKNYEEAMKCYKTALRFDSENIQIIRDLALLQIQIRDLEGFCATRKLLLNLKPSTKIYWIGLAQAYHFLKDYDTALQVLDGYEDNSKGDVNSNPIELNEFVMYKNRILEQSGNYEAALSHLLQNEHLILDKFMMLEKKTLFLSKLNRKEEAMVNAKLLLAENNSNQSYYMLVEEILADKERILEFYREMQQNYPKCLSAKINPLNFIAGEEFSVQFQQVIEYLVSKEIPSLFQLVKHLYRDADKVQRIEDVMEAMLKTTCGNMKLWTLTFLSHHFDHKEEYERALLLIDEAIETGPNVVELQLFKGRILKHMGKFEDALNVVESARLKDLSDRYLNSKSAKYFLRVGKIKEAEKTISLFLRAQSLEGLQDIIDMQCLWFLVEKGEALVRKGDLKGALDQFAIVEKIFNEILDDQFDFHAYCARKMTLTAYEQLIKCEDELFSNKWFKRSASNAIKCILKQRKEIENQIETLSLEKSSLDRAFKLLKKLPSDYVEGHVLGYQLYSAQGKWTLAFKHLKQSFSLEPHNPKVFINMVSFSKQVPLLAENVKNIISEEFNELIGNDFDRYKSFFYEENKHSPLHLFALYEAHQDQSYWKKLLDLSKISIKDAIEIRQSIADVESLKEFNSKFP